MYYTKEMDLFFFNNLDKSNTELVDLFYEKFEKVISPSAAGHKKARVNPNYVPKPTRHHWTKQQEEWLMNNSKGEYYQDITSRFNKLYNTNLSQSSIEHKCFRLGCKNGVDMRYANMEKLEKYRYQKGHLPDHTQPVGTISVCTQRYKKNGKPYEFKFKKIKLKDEPFARDNWERLHIHVWKQHHGEIPEGKTIVFKDQDTMNCNIENLELLDVRELLIMNKNGFWSDDLVHNVAAINLSKLMNKIYELEKEK